MKAIHKFMSESFAKSAARFMNAVCYMMIALSLAGLVLSFMGRQTFILYTPTATYDRAIYAEENHDWVSRGPTVSLKDDIRVTTDSKDGKVDLAMQIGLSAMYAITILPRVFAYWFLSRVFKNISEGQIFIEKNAAYLLYYGLIEIAVAALVPFLKIAIGHIANQFSGNDMSAVTGQNILNDLLPNIAFIIAAYIIHYGVHLQDEADHTL
jgi:hypothetical protein